MLRYSIIEEQTNFYNTKIIKQMWNTAYLFITKKWFNLIFYRILNTKGKIIKYLFEPVDTTKRFNQKIP